MPTVSMQDWLSQHSETSEAHKRLFLTEEEVRSFPQFKDATPEEVENIISTLHDLALVCYGQFCRDTYENKSVSKAA